MFVCAQRIYFSSAWSIFVRLWNNEEVRAVCVIFRRYPRKTSSALFPNSNVAMERAIITISESGTVNIPRNSVWISEWN